MSDAIQFLETLGASPAASGLHDAGYAEALAALELEPAQEQALAGRDAGALSRLLDGRPAMLCMIATPDGGETEDAPDKSDDDGEQPDSTEDAPDQADRPD
ncbi:hypothetical protein [Luteimonas vadosa]|uniref:Uncharacterized protein n=1 Tax=Luteimonas vadosa TaxID=1165507 RepID=A0ABP9E905_9GAMM